MSATRPRLELSLVLLALACGPKPAVETPTEPADAGVDATEPVDAAPDVPVDVAPIDAGPHDPIPEMTHALQLGGEVSCLLDDGAVYCWGSNRFGELATSEVPMGARGRRESARRIQLPSEARALSVGMWHACVILDEGTLRCWGHDGWGQLGDGAREDRTEPVAVAGLESIVQVSAGGGHTCARSADRRAWCWGRNDRGQLGDGTTEARLEPTLLELDGLTPDNGVMEIRAARAHTCARLEDGSVWCWGENVDGQLGDGTRSPPEGHRGTPARVEGVDDARAIRLGGGASCAVVGDSAEPLCWGRNDSRQLVARPGGRPDSALREPTSLGTSGITELGLGSRFTCVLAEGTVRCAGLNHRGQLGDGTRQLRRALTPVDFADVTQLGVGTEHACARTERGHVRCWGANRRGQLGDGTIRWRKDPVPVTGVPRPDPPPDPVEPDPVEGQPDADTSG